MNTIQKSLILGAQGAVIIILAYLIALSEIELSIDIPAMVAPTSSVTKVSSEKEMEQKKTGNLVFCDSFTCLSSNLESCQENTIIKVALKEDFRSLQDMQDESTAGNQENFIVDYKSIFKVNGVNDLGQCVVSQVLFDSKVEMEGEVVEDSPEFRTIQLINFFMSSMAGSSAVCSGQGADMSAYFHDIIFDLEVSGEKMELSVTETGTKLLYDNKVTCLSGPYHGFVIVNRELGLEEEISLADVSDRSFAELAELSGAECTSVDCLSTALAACEPVESVLNYTRFLPLGIASFDILSQFKVMGLDEFGVCKIQENILKYNVFIDQSEKDWIQSLAISNAASIKTEMVLAELESAALKQGRHAALTLDDFQEIVEYSGSSEDLLAYFKGLITKESIHPSLPAPNGDLASMLDYNISISAVY